MAEPTESSRTVLRCSDGERLDLGTEALFGGRSNLLNSLPSAPVLFWQ